MTAENQPPIVRMEDYNGIWSIRHSPLHAPKPLLNKLKEPIRSWSHKELEFICSDQSGLSELAKHNILEPVEQFIWSVGGTHYAIFAFGYLQVYRLMAGETAIEGDWK